MNDTPPEHPDDTYVSEPLPRVQAFAHLRALEKQFNGSINEAGDELFFHAIMLANGCYRIAACAIAPNGKTRRIVQSELAMIRHVAQ
jgi:hypothetical protein